MSVVKASASPLFLAFNRRFDPGILEMKRRIVAGEIGALELVTVISKDPAGGLPIEYLKTSGGMFRDMTIHDFDMARHIMGEEFVSIQATAGSLTDPAIKEIENRRHRHCHRLDAADREWADRCHHQLAAGELRLRSAGRSTWRARHAAERRTFPSISLCANAPRACKGRCRAILLRRALRAATRTSGHILSVCSRARKHPPPSGEDGHKALGLAEAAYRSLETQSRVAIAA